MESHALAVLSKILLCAKKGDFTPDEDQIITDYVEREGRQWSVLAKQLGRVKPTSVKHRYELLSYDFKGGPFTAKEDEIILREVFIVNKNILTDGSISSEVWRRIGEKLGRNPPNVLIHWSSCMEPTLLRHHAGTLHMDVRKVLINHLLEHQMNYVLDVNWKELVKLTKFVGSTTRYLQRKLDSMRTNTGKMYPELREEELTTEAIQRWYNSSNRNSTKKKDEYQEELVSFYLANIYQVVGEK